MVSGGMISWLGLIPIIAYFGENVSTPMFPEMVLPIKDMSADLLWERYIRYIGAGAVAAAGIITVIKALPVMFDSLMAGIKQITASNSISTEEPLRTQKDLPMSVVLIGVIAVILVLALTPKILGVDITFTVRIIAAICIAIFAFCFVTVSSRIVGLVGVTSNPTSGMTIVTLLGTATIFYIFGWTGDIGKTTALTVGTVVAIAASIAGDTSQDLKCGYLIGASPNKQQIAELIGVLSSAFFIVLAVWLLGRVYQFGSADLPAPQATLIKTVIEGVMQADLPWGLVLTGVTFGIVAELVGLPSLAFAVGMYIPLSTWTPIFVGGCIRYFVEKSTRGDEPLRKHKEEQGVLLGSGFVAGEGVMAVIISFYAYIVGHKPEAVSWALSETTGKIVSLLAFAAVGFFLVQMTRKRSEQPL
jgi:putative OPT family oligopeptide transporter